MRLSEQPMRFSEYPMQFSDMDKVEDKVVLGYSPIDAGSKIMKS